jgi:hypothetical protein
VTGTIVNTAAVILGSLFGLLVRRAWPSARLTKWPSDEAAPLPTIVMQALGLVTVALGIKMALETRQMLVVIISIVLGAVIGQLSGIEAALERFAVRLKRLTASSESTFVTGFVTASVLYCVGPMTILGSIQNGLQHDPQLLLIKAVMDGVSSVILASTLGIGVLFSCLTVLVTQGLLTLLAAQMRFLVEPLYLSEFTAVGGIIIAAIGIRLLGLKDIKAGNLLPGLVLVVLIVLIASRCHWLS